jgi:molecular chaperone GrpE (heat shock protein)
MLKIISKKNWDWLNETLEEAHDEIVRKKEEIKILEEMNLGLKELLSQEEKKLASITEEFANFKSSLQKEREKKIKETLNSKKKWLKAEYGEDYGK